MSQAANILAYMQQGNPITALEALDLFGCFRLAARIKDLKDQGHSIASRPFTTTGGATISEYYIPAPTQGQLNLTNDNTT